jgi:hypothetical protein
LEANGESWNKCNPLPTLLLVVKNILQIVKQAGNEISRKACLLLGRLNFQHNKILQNPAEILAKESLANYRDYVAGMSKAQTIDMI